jgi:hypothetical protein
MAAANIVARDFHKVSNEGVSKRLDDLPSHDSSGLIRGKRGVIFIYYRRSR